MFFRFPAKAAAAVAGGGSLKSPKLDVLCVCDVGACPSPPQPSSSPPTALAVGAVPVVLGAVGFTGAGITASSLAAKMMSAAAMANGGGVAASSPVATLQSVGSGGLSLSSKVLLGSTGFALVSLVVGL
ncbi:interferon alpha-inducible protein 27, mitochondrial isoform X2 [Monodon monoceros]|uniref:interferon alpha-inducible protein 27, mitochondrial isoform X2 n=1 Tax=Monodon monoceros TaxID=40151 RepID=UPI0010F8C7DA|nr:interferon alpha-inducible protein 27, mitochondrial isoform X2 [Monodon monoceros]